MTCAVERKALRAIFFHYSFRVPFCTYVNVNMKLKACKNSTTFDNQSNFHELRFNTKEIDGSNFYLWRFNVDDELIHLSDLFFSRGLKKSAPGVPLPSIEECLWGFV